MMEKYATASTRVRSHGMRYLDPSNDFVFKILFKDPSDEKRLIAMLTAILEPSSPIISAKVMNPQIPPNVATAKLIVLDVLVQLDDGRAIGIEMETCPRRVFVNREVFYWARTHSNQLDVGEDYVKLRPTIVIAWLADPRDRSRSIVDDERLHTRYRICETTSKRELTDQLEIHLLDLRKLTTDGTLTKPLRRWAQFFAHPTAEVLQRLAEEDDIMAETIEKLASGSADDENYYIAEARFRGEVRRRLDMASEREEGVEEGEAAGEARTLVYAVVTVLEARFGALPSDLRARIESADVIQLRQLLSRGAVATSLADVGL